MGSVLRHVLPVLAFVLVCFSVGEAHAKRGIVLITSGDSITKVADLDAAVAEEVKQEIGDGAAIGYKYEQFGIFWLEVWSWDGQYVLFRGDEFWDVPEAELAAMAGVGSLDELSKPLTYRIPPGLAIIVLAVVGFGIFALVGGKDDDDEAGAEAVAHAGAPAGGGLAADPRYQQALQAYHANPGGAHEHKLAAAVALLGQHGIAPAEAQANLLALLSQGQHPPAAM